MEVRVKVESTECPTCLSEGRSLQAVAPELRDYALSANCNVSLDSNVLVCWECSAMLRKAMLFNWRVARAQQALAWAHTQDKKIYMKRPLSSLKCALKTDYDFEICHEERPQPMPFDETTYDIKEDSRDAWSDDIKPDCNDENDPKIKSEPAEEPVKEKTLKSKILKKRAVHSNKMKLSEMNAFTTVPMTETEMREMRETDRRESKYARSAHRCDTCIMKFASAKKLAQHDKNCHSEECGAHVCDVCLTRFPSLAQLQRHAARHYERFECNECGLRTRRAQPMYRHYLFQHKSAGLHCEECGVLFGTKNDMSRHRRLLHTNFQCDMCGQNFHSRRTIEKHMYSRHLPSRCPDCGVSVKSRVSLAQHRYRRHAVHSPTADSYCVECDKQFRHRLAYKDHVAVVHRTAPQYACPDCGKQFTRGIYMRNHRELVHLNTGKFRCDKCDKGFLRQDGLQRHMKHVHERVPLPRTKVCEHCGRAFQTNRILANHRRTHTGERPYQCELCSAAFAQQTALKSHVKHIHEHCARSK